MIKGIFSSEKKAEKLPLFDNTKKRKFRGRKRNFTQRTGDDDET